MNSSDRDPAGAITTLLEQAKAGHRHAEAEFYGLVYEELRRVAGGMMGCNRRGTLQPTALVNELYLKLAEGGKLADMPNRRYFYTAVADQMRKLLIDHYRRRKSIKRGGQFQRTPWDGALDAALDEFEQLNQCDVLALEQALIQLRDQSERQWQVVSLRFYAGRTVRETAELLGVSVGAVERDWRLARSKLYARLRD